MAITYAFGWRPSLPDIRDRKFVPQPELVLPPSIDLDVPSPGAPFDPSWDQGQLGSCGPNTLGENIAYVDIKDDGVSHGMPSRLFMYYNTRVLMNTVNSDSGVDNRTMLKALAQYGYCDESLWPYDINKFTQKPPQAAYDQAAKRETGIVYQSVNQDLTSMKSCLVQTGKPFIFGFTVYNSMLTKQVEQTGDIPLPGGILDRVAGGHDVLICGYDDATQRFKIKNHWTAEWGKNGYGTIPYAYATDPQLAGDFWTVTKVPLNGGTTVNPLISDVIALVTALAAKDWVAVFAAIAKIVKDLTSGTTSQADVNAALAKLKTLS